MKKIQLLPIALLSLYMSSCQDKYDICDQEKAVNFKGVFYKKIAGGEAETAVPLLTISPIGSTTTIIDHVANASAFVFTLNPTVDSAKYIFQIDNTGVKDTVTIHYTSQQKTLSLECGDITTHSLSSAKTTLYNLDSVKISNSKIDNIAVANLKVYY